MKLNSQNGITMLSLVVYIASFLVITAIIAGITMFFYNNTSLMNVETFSAAEYNKLNMYLVKQSEESGNKLTQIDQNRESSINYIEFSNGDRFTLDKNTNLLYYNKICICEDVQNLEVKQDYTTGKEVINVKVEFTNKTYTNKYTMAQ